MKINIEDLFIKAQKNTWLLEDALWLACEDLSNIHCCDPTGDCRCSDCVSCWREHLIERANNHGH